MEKKLLYLTSQVIKKIMMTLENKSLDRKNTYNDQIQSYDMIFFGHIYTIKIISKIKQ